MPPQSDKPDAHKEGELAAADQAYDRLVEFLRHLQHEIDDLAQERALRSGEGLTNRKLRLKHAAMLQALQRHAQTTIANFAFVDGERVDHPHDDLLTVFYTDPKDSVSSRYCWALLREASGPDPPLAQLTAAIRAEHVAFRRGQMHKEPMNGIGGPGDVATLLTAYQKRADRLFYTVALLQRLLLMQRQESGSGSAQSRELERGIVELSDDAHLADSDLRKVRLKWLAAKR